MLVGIVLTLRGKVYIFGLGSPLEPILPNQTHTPESKTAIREGILLVPPSTFSLALRDQTGSALTTARPDGPETVGTVQDAFVEVRVGVCWPTRTVESVDTITTRHTHT